MRYAELVKLLMLTMLLNDQFDSAVVTMYINMC